MTNVRIRTAVAIIAVANLAYFGIEVAVGWHIASVSLFADSVDFLEDACINILFLWDLDGAARITSASAPP